MALEGSLKEFNLADILQLLYFQKKTGALLLQGRFDRVRLLFFEGNIVGAESRKRDAENRLGRVLVKRGIATAEDIQSAIDRQKEEGGKFGAVLVRLGIATKEQIQDVITFQITETLVQLFTWKEGRYEFQPQSIPIDRETGVMLNTEHFLMEGARLVDEWSLIKDRIDIESVFMPVEGDREGLSPEEGKILAHVDGENDVGAIALITGIDSYQVSSTLLGLLEKNLIARKKAAPVSAPKAAKKVEVKPSPALGVALVAILLAAFAVSFVAFFYEKSAYKKFQAWEQIDLLRFTLESRQYRDGAYPASINKLDPWGNPYLYGATEDDVVIMSAGPDGGAGTPDDVR